MIVTLAERKARKIAMSDAQWIDVEEDIDAAVVHLKNALALSEIGQFGGGDLESYRDEMALMHAMQLAHTSAESTLKRILCMLDEELPLSDDWPQQLINRLAKAIEGDHARPALLDRETMDDLQETRTFRHHVRYSYGSFEISRAEPVLAAARRLVVSLPAQVSRFRRLIDSFPERIGPEV